MTAAARPGRGVEVITFGCRLNLVESAAMRRLATTAGHADLAIVNTCAVTAEATRQGLVYQRHRTLRSWVSALYLKA